MPLKSSRVPVDLLDRRGLRARSARQEAQAERAQEAQGQSGPGGDPARPIDPRFRVGQQPPSDPYHLRGQLLDIEGLARTGGGAWP